MTVQPKSVPHGMHVTRAFIVVCHLCPDMDWSTDRDAHEAREAFAGRGWTYLSGTEQAYCPECSEAQS